MNKHTFWMIIGCTVPLLLIFLLPLFGITGNYSFLIFIIAMFACHLLMPMHNEVMSDHQGKYPKCGMKLVKQKMTAEQQKIMNKATYTKPEN